MRRPLRILAWILLGWAVFEYIMGGVENIRIVYPTVWGILLYYLSSKNRGIICMKEIEEFESCLRRLGVPYSKHKWTQHHPDSKDQIFVSQALFHFTKDGKFLAVEDDEMGNWRSRVQYSDAKK